MYKDFNIRTKRQGIQILTSIIHHHITCPSAALIHLLSSLCAPPLTSLFFFFFYRLAASSSRRQRAGEHKQQEEEEVEEVKIETEQQQQEEEKMVGNDGYIMFSPDEAYDGLFDKIDDLLDFTTTEDDMHIAPLQPCHEHDGSLLSQPNPERESCFSLLSPPLPLPPAYDDMATAAGLINAFNADDDDTFHCDDFDAAELEWLSNFVEESFSPTPAAADLLIASDTTFQMIDISNTINNNDTFIKEKREEEEVVQQYRTPSPVSVLEHTGIIITGPGGPQHSSDSATSASFSTFSASWSSSSSSPSPTSSSSCSTNNNTIMPFSTPPEAGILFREKRKRTQRSRPATALPRGNIVVPPFAVVAPPTPIPSCENAADPFNPGPEAAEFNAYCWESKMLEQHEKKKKKAKVSSPAVEKGGNAEGSQEEPAVSETTPVASAAASARKCMHCEIQKTPQWRAGPMGPKTLCNACGVRYKSGRLFPEYRPAASPTFMASVHSNSHKKVVEMRIKATTQMEEGPAAERRAAPPQPVSTKACELLNYIRGPGR